MVTSKKIIDVERGVLRYRTVDEQRELARVRQRNRYWDSR